MPDHDKALFGFLAPGGQVLAAAFRYQAKGIVSQAYLAFSSAQCGEKNDKIIGLQVRLR